MEGTVYIGAFIFGALLTIGVILNRILKVLEGISEHLEKIVKQEDQP